MTSADAEYRPIPQPHHIITDPAVASALSAQAELDTRIECCGLLIGLDKWRDGSLMIDQIVPSVNLTAGQAEDSFEIDPALHLKWRRQLRGTGRAVVGLYHSHPNGSSHPSEADHQGARLEPGLAWLILPLGGDGKARYPAAYWATKHLLAPLPLKIEG